MPNGKCYHPHRIPGAYTCYICRDLKDADEFYKDSTRYNGCSSRCKRCDDDRNETRRATVKQSFVGSAKALNAPRTKKSNRSQRQERKRMDDLKGDREGQDLIGSVYRRVVQRDAVGLPLWIEKTTFDANGDIQEVTFEKV